MTHDDRITLSGLRLYGYHGVLDFERQYGQVFVVDLVLSVDIVAAASHDEVNYTANYAEVAQTVRDVVTGESVALIETLAVRIADAVLDSQPLVDAVEATVHKPSAPIPDDFDNVAVTVSRGRSGEEF